jgi:hypothetical protein
MISSTAESMECRCYTDPNLAVGRRLQRLLNRRLKYDQPGGVVFPAESVSNHFAWAISAKFAGRSKLVPRCASRRGAGDTPPIGRGDQHHQQKEEDDRRTHLTGNCGER